MPSRQLAIGKMTVEFLAVVEHYRWWLGEDQIDVRRIAKTGKIDPETVRAIARRYNVNRGIRKRNDKRDTEARGIAKLLNNAAKRWPTGLVERAEKCSKVAEKAKRYGYTGGHLASAITKLMWFVKPNGWTMYDGFAATGLGIERKEARERMPEFYRELENRGFREIVADINRTLRATPLLNLKPERVIDKYLWLWGAPMGRRQRTEEDCRIFLQMVLPRPISKRLISTARRIASKVCFDRLTTKSA
jgi:hypothetical protein